MKPELALLVDGDQMPTEGLPGLLKDLAKKWTVSDRIVVRNWRSTRDQQEWREFSDENGFRCIQRDPVATGKNAADIELAIMTVDLLRDGRRAFCLVTGDTDFTPVVQRIRRSGAHIEWVRPSALDGYHKPSRGRTTRAVKKTAKPAQTAKKQTKAAAKKAPASKAPAKTAARTKAKPAPEADTAGFAKALRRAISALRKEGKHEHGWVSVNRIGSILAEQGIHKEDFGFPKRRAMYEVIDACGLKTEQLETGAYRVTLD